MNLPFLVGGLQNMPQEKRRSIRYRSFVTCDDPKGVIECGSIRKPKASSPPQKSSSKIIEQVEKKQGNHKKPLLLEEEEDNKKEMKKPASFQLLEVSKGAENLNHVINSWSNNSSIINQGQQKDIAKDLLKGALDLQESILMLTKLQEASSYVSRLTREEKQKLEEGRFDGMVKEIMESNYRFGYMQDERVDMGFDRPRFSCDGCSRKSSFDEMRKVVRDSLLRQNVINNPIFEEHFEYRRFGSPDMPCTSSSQSSMIHSSNFAPSESSASSSVSQRKNAKGSNLIVKLMGLESLPSSPRKHREAEKILNLSKPMYDFDSPKARKPQFGAQELGTKQRSVNEILETLKFKGLLRSNSVNESLPYSPCSDTFSSESRWCDERPPIVVMKPLHFPCLDLKQQTMPKFRGDDYMRTKETVMRSRSRRGAFQETDSSDCSSFSDKCKDLDRRDEFEGKSKSMKKVASKAKSSFVDLHQKPQNKQAEVRKPSELVKVTPTRRKVEEKKVAKSNKGLGSRDQVKLTTSKVKKQKDGVFNSKNQTSSSQKKTCAAVSDHRTKETFKSPSKRERIRQPAVTGENQRCKGQSKDCKATVRDENETVLPTVEQAEASQIQITDYDIDDQSSISDAREGAPCLDNYKKISLCDHVLTKTHDSAHHPDDNQSFLSDLTSPSITEHCSVGQLDEIQSPLHEITLSTTHENGVPVHLDGIQTTSLSIQYEDGRELSNTTDYGTSEKPLTPRSKHKTLLLRSPSFMSRAEELFDLQVNPKYAPSISDDSDTDGVSEVDSNDKVLIDCANEIMELQSLRFSQACFSLPTIYATTNPRNSVSLDRLLEEICNGLDDLKGYLQPTDVNFPSDSLYVLLARDMNFKSGTWDIGWKNMFSQEEIDKVIADVDKLVLGKLVEEVLTDFLL